MRKEASRTCGYTPVKITASCRESGNAGKLADTFSSSDSTVLNMHLEFYKYGKRSGCNKILSENENSINHKKGEETGCEKKLLIYL